MNDKDKQEDRWLTSLEDWAFENNGEPLSPETMAEIRGRIVRAIAEQKIDSLNSLGRRLSPVAAELADKLYEWEVKPQVLQTVEIPVYAAVIREILDYLYYHKPETAMASIRLGPELLRILAAKKNQWGDDPVIRGTTELRLKDLQRKLAGTAVCECRKPSASKVSRALRALEESGFIMLTGATRNRGYKLLAKGLVWIKQENQQRRTHREIDAMKPASSCRARAITAESPEWPEIIPVPVDLDFFNDVMQRSEQGCAL